MDLEQRVADLEVLLSVPRGAESALPRLRNLYLDVRLGKLGDTPRDVYLWELAMLTLTRTACIELGRAVGDPFVWRWFLAATLKYAAQGYDVEDTTERIKEVSRGILQVQGLRVLGLADASHARVISIGNNTGKSPIRG